MTVANARLSPDPRDRSLELAKSTLPSLESLPSFRYYDGGSVTASASDVASAWYDWLYANPDITPPADLTVWNLYREAQLLDPWPGEHPQIVGTDLRSGWHALFLRGAVGEARYLFDLETITRCVLGRCPVVCATDWYDDMANLSGPSVGRHAFLIDGVSTTDGTFRIRDEEKTRLPFEYVNYLLGHDGEAMIALNPA